MKYGSVHIFRAKVTVSVAWGYMGRDKSIYLFFHRKPAGLVVLEFVTPYYLGCSSRCYTPDCKWFEHLKNHCYSIISNKLIYLSERFMFTCISRLCIFSLLENKSSTISVIKEHLNFILVLLK